MTCIDRIPPSPLLEQIELCGQPWSPVDDPKLVRIRPEPLAVVATGPGWEYEAEHIPSEADIMVINQAGCELVWRPIKWWASLHSGLFPLWKQEREENGGDNGYTAVSPFYSARGGHEIVEVGPWGGTSSLYGVLAGLIYGYRDIRLYGVPLAGRPDMDGEDSFVHDQWELLLPILKKYVTAPCPGWTRWLFHKCSEAPSW
jgi:hypothetical protein